MKVVGRPFFQEVWPHRQKGAARPSKGLDCYIFLEIKERLKMKGERRKQLRKKDLTFTEEII